MNRRWTLWIAAALVTTLAPPASAAAGKVTGKFLGNGKEAKLAHALAVPHEKWQNEEAWSVVLTEQPAPAAGKPDWDASFGKLGSALVVSVTAGGAIFGTEVYHQALEHKPFSSVGAIQLEGFEIDQGKISGRLHMTAPDEFFGDTWQVDITFEAPKRAGAK
jgi:hypothetical protein